MKMGKLFVALLALGMMAMASVSFAAEKAAAPSYRNEPRSKVVLDAGKELVPSSAKLTGYKTEGTATILDYRDFENYIYYTVKVDTKTGKRLQYTTQTAATAGTVTVLKTEADVKAIIEEQYPGCKDVAVTTAKLVNDIHYEASFTTVGGDKGFCLVNPTTGVITKKVITYK